MIWVFLWTPLNHSWELHRIEAQLSRDTGLIVEVEKFRRPSPSSLHLYGIHATQAETNREVAHIRELQWLDDGDEVAILMHQPEIQSRELASVWSVLHDRFLCQPELTATPVRVAANDLTIHSYSDAVTLRDVDAWVGHREDSVEAIVQCVPAVSPIDTPITITVARDHNPDGANPVTHWNLNTTDTPLPCSVLADYLPNLEYFGGEATFTGNMSWQLEGKDWWIDLGGSRFEHVSLDRMFEQHAHRLSGRAVIQLDRCRFESGNQRSDMSGSIRAYRGMIGRPLLESMNKHLGFDISRQALSQTMGDVQYDLIALGFDLNNTQLKLTGICNTEEAYHDFPRGAALCFGNTELVRSSGQSMDAVQVLTAIAPTHSVLVPISGQTGWLSKVLIPPSRPAVGDARFPPQIRSAGPPQGGPQIMQPGWK